MTQEDIIEWYVDTVSKYLDAPPVFIRASAYHLVSTLLGRYFKCSDLPGMPGIGFRPNLWFLLSSIPGRTRRSTVMNYTNHVYKRVMTAFLPSKVEKSKDTENLVLDTIIEEGTPEGIMDHVHDTRKYIDAYVITSSEFGSVLSSMNSKESQKGVSTLYSKLYYGEGGSVRLSKRNTDRPSTRYMHEGKYFNMFCSMQEPKYYLSPIHLRQGLLRRIIMIYCKTSDIDPNKWIPPVTQRANIFLELNAIIDEFLDRMEDYHAISKGNLIETMFGGTVRNTINDYAKVYDFALIKQETNFNIYKQTAWEHLAKLAMTKAIARGSIKADNLFVQTQDITESLSFLNEATKHTNEIINNLSHEDIPIMSAENNLERIFSIISEFNPIGRSKLYRKANMRSSDLEEYLITLRKQNRIKLEEVLTGGRTKYLYHIIET